MVSIHSSARTRPTTILPRGRVDGARIALLVAGARDDGWQGGRRRLRRRGRNRLGGRAGAARGIELRPHPRAVNRQSVDCVIKGSALGGRLAVLDQLVG